MAEVREQGELGASVDEVWKVVGDFVGLIEGMGVPVESEGEGIGMTRKISMGPQPIIEKLEERDEAAKKLVYSIVEGPLRGLSAVIQGRTTARQRVLVLLDLLQRPTRVELPDRWLRLA